MPDHGPSLRVRILVISTTAAQDQSSDASGPKLRDVFNNEGYERWSVEEVRIVGDDESEIRQSITAWTDGDHAAHMIVTTGGTGFAVSDRTPEAIGPLLHKHAPGLVHGMLAASREITPFALMSRPVAGIRHGTVIVTLPGSPKGAVENLQAIIKLLPHACLQAQGGDSRQLHAGGIQRLEQDAGVKPAPSQPTLHGPTCGHHSPASGIPKRLVRYTVQDCEQPSQKLSNDPGLGPSQRSRASPYPMVPVAEALSLIEQHTPRARPILLPVSADIVGHVVAESVVAREAVPAYRASIVDGYAISAPADVQVRGTYPIKHIMHAKAGITMSLLSGELARITTGAPVPMGEDISVIMVEDTTLRSTTEDGSEEATVEILADHVQPGANIREIGSDITAGSTILESGTVISAAGGELGLLASAGVTELLGYRKPCVGILSTGDEVVEHSTATPLVTGQIRDCNRPVLISIFRNMGYEVHDLGVAKDSTDELEQTLRRAFTKVDVLITTGGVSMGELDLLKPTVERRLGGTIHFGRVAMKPGKPTTFATVSVKDEAGQRAQKVIFSLPGNPASAIVTAYLFVLPALHWASGVRPLGLPEVKVELGEAFAMDKNRSEYHRATVTVDARGVLVARSTGGQRSSRVGSVKGANALVCLPAGDGLLPKGELVNALLMGQIR